MNFDRELCKDPEWGSKAKSGRFVLWRLTVGLSAHLVIFYSEAADFFKIKTIQKNNE